ncbi:type VI secretion system protein [Pseudoduganella violaceinigra]|uniref:type VI secretion system protein n=1 Tax=Pseudoduganella violaceinigra TaxID=246602 RepID=UPI0003F9DE07|nr:type VI secretion system protein [Pseudoduganella violaceinigra]
MTRGGILAIVIASLGLLLASLLAWYVLRLARKRALARASGKAPAADKGPVAAAVGLVPAVRAAFTGREEEGSAAYAMPLVLLAGERDAARSTLEHAPDDGKPLSWHASPQGWVLQADMAAFGFDSEENCEAWQALAEQLERRRPRRPLDGILLAIPADALCGAQAWSPLEVERRAGLARRRLGELQRLFGLRLPVYLLLTRCDQLDGFADFAMALPDGLRVAMLGWSNPNDPEIAYAPVWLSDAFSQIGRTVVDLQAELAATGAEGAGSDSFFLLPGAIARMAGPCSSYAARLLEDDARSISPMLRGLYLCGDPATVLGTIPARPWFAGDLLARKVFPERGLARPLGGQLLSRNKGVRRWAAACAAVLVIWGGALLWGHAALKIQAERLHGALKDINQEQERRTTDREKKGHMEYDAYKTSSQHIVAAMLDSHGSLSQLAIPASWQWTGWQDLDRRVEGQFGKGLQNIVYRTLDKALNKSVEEQTGATKDRATYNLSDERACHIRAGGEHAELSAGAVLSDAQAFKRLDRYVADAGLFEQARKHLDSLHQLHQGEYRDLVKVAAYTGAFELPTETAYGASPLLKAALNNQYPPEDAQLQRERQVKSILCAFHEEHGQFLASMIENHPARRAAHDVAEHLRAGRALGSADQEHGLIPALQQLSAWLAAPTLRWMDEAESGEGKAYGELLRKVEANSLLGQDAADWARKQRAEQVKRLLRELTDPVGGGHALVQRGGDGKLGLTPELANLQAGLERLSRQAFMAEAGAPEALARQGLGPLWDMKKLNQTLLQANEARAYLDKEVPGFPLPFQPELRRYTGQRLADSLLASAGAALASGSSEADTYQRLGQAQKLLTALLETLDGLDAPEQHRILADALAQQANAGLRWLERELVEGGLYRPRDGGFDWWQGTPNPAAQGFSGGDAQALEDYLLAQQARIEASVRQAQPLLRLAEAAQGNLSSAPARRWSEIAAELARFQEKQPNARMAQLHAFIRNDLANADGRNCQGPIAAQGSDGVVLAPARLSLTNKSAPATGGSDLFSERRRFLASALASRCLALGRAELDHAYLALREQFRRTLAGHFPFAEAGRNSEAASLDDVLAYLQLYDQLAPDSQRMAPGRAREFVAASASARRFLGPLLPAAEGADSAGYLLGVRFRVGNTGEADGNNALAGELGGNRIAAWMLQSGDETISWDGGTKGAVQQLPWRPGMPMVLTLRWADNVADLPLEDGSDRYLKVEGRQAVYRFNEPWSLLRLLARHGLPASGPARPSTLRFELPAAPGGQRTRVYLRLAVMPAQKKEVLAFPVFPAAAPGDETQRLIARP